ncbi:hypothetical protein Cgig2_002414 [Carnegiea gigantea]|uniref:Neprosin PEP catalytic domain-containing protein n=1 Tax=Carnegiea gigantea TaxID=171969 RepID=A0A9Q1KVB5_9CARY|nr:hypothetical protein Cgig2_002414 [Carnegiea gigantea]
MKHKWTKSQLSLSSGQIFLVQRMALKIVLSFLFSLLPIIDGHGDTTFPKLEDLGRRKQLGHLNKPSVKTVKTEYGDIYECVDFYKQPAFNHPALKNHNFHPQMRPSFRMQQVSSAHTFPKDAKSISVGLKDKSCPVGTVPITRVKEDHLKRIESLMMNYTSKIDPHSIPLKPGTNVAIAQTKPGGSQVYYGVGANLSLHNPPVFSYEYSSGQLGIQGGPDSIQVGWTDPMSGNWWLEVGPDYTPIGFWPNRIFTSLAKSGSYVACGGEAYHPPDIPGVPHMGSGFKPSRHTNFNAYCFGFFVLNEQHKVTVKVRTEGYTNAPQFYGIVDEFIVRGFLDKDDIAGSGNSDVQVNGTNISLELQHRVVYGGTQVLS